MQILPEKTEVKEGEIVYVDVNIAGKTDAWNPMRMKK